MFPEPLCCCWRCTLSPCLLSRLVLQQPPSGLPAAPRTTPLPPNPLFPRFACHNVPRRLIPGAHSPQSNLTHAVLFAPLPLLLSADVALTPFCETLFCQWKVDWWIMEHSGKPCVHPEVCLHQCGQACTLSQPGPDEATWRAAGVVGSNGTITGWCLPNFFLSTRSDPFGILP